ncbi:MAG: hypothetical protein H7211_02860, partial [Aquabacterium sp.]|nr:hypothetical protein [Ferruginibacter sp.]
MDYVGAINDVDVLGKNDYDLYPDYSAAISIEEDQFVFNTGKSLFNKETLNANMVLVFKDPFHK